MRASRPTVSGSLSRASVNGNLDVYLIPSGGGNAKQLTAHSADDIVLGWSNYSRSVLFSSNHGEDFAAQLYLVSVDGGAADLRR